MLLAGATPVDAVRLQLILLYLLLGSVFTAAVVAVALCTAQLLHPSPPARRSGHPPELALRDHIVTSAQPASGR